MASSRVIRQRFGWDCENGGEQKRPLLVIYDQREGGADSALVIDIGIDLSPGTEKHSGIP